MNLPLPCHHSQHSNKDKSELWRAVWEPQPLILFLISTQFEFPILQCLIRLNLANYAVSLYLSPSLRPITFHLLNISPFFSLSRPPPISWKRRTLFGNRIKSVAKKAFSGLDALEHLWVSQNALRPLRRTLPKTDAWEGCWQFNSVFVKGEERGCIFYLFIIIYLFLNSFYCLFIYIFFAASCSEYRSSQLSAFSPFARWTFCQRNGI